MKYLVIFIAPGTMIGYRKNGLMDLRGALGIPGMVFERGLIEMKLKNIICEPYDLFMYGLAMYAVSMIPLTWIIALKWAGVI